LDAQEVSSTFTNHNGIVKLVLKSEGEKTNSQGVGRFVVAVNGIVAGAGSGTGKQAHC
jgi:hypothetical protein